MDYTYYSQIIPYVHSGSQSIGSELYDSTLQNTKNKWTLIPANHIIFLHLAHFPLHYNGCPPIL